MDDFDNVSWNDEGPSSTDNRQPIPIRRESQDQSSRLQANGDEGLQAGVDADAVDLAGPGHGTLSCEVAEPLKENDGTKDAYISYLVTTTTDMKSFQKTGCSVRRRFTDFVFLYKTLCKEYPASAVPPLPDKHKMEYVTGNRFGPDFTNPRAHSLNRFLKRLTLHPVFRRSAILVIFLESPDWNAHMRTRPQRGSSSQENNTVFDNLSDTFVNAFSKVHKPDKRFIEVKDKSNKLDDDLSQVEKFVARVARKEADLETDYTDLSQQFMKLSVMEPGIENATHGFAQSVEETSQGMCGLKEHTDQNYLGSLRDMEQYSSSVKSLLRSREQKQLDFEGLTDYLGKSVQERDSLASHNTHTSITSPAGFVRSKLEDLRGIDHEQSRRERQRKLELQIDRLTTEVDGARKTSEMFDEEVVKEIETFERIKASEFRDTLGELAQSHIKFYQGIIDTWERYINEMEKEGPVPEL